MPSCATFYGPAPGEPLSIHDATAVISGIKDQAKKVSSFYTRGSISVKDWKWESEADILIAGIKNPLRIKIEITHPWGRPILHILIDNMSLKVLSFEEKRLYLGDFSPDALSRFFPGRLFDTDTVWAVLRGYPHIIKHHSTASSRPNQISLLNNKEKEIIDLLPESHLPGLVSFPAQQLNLAFSEFQDTDGIYYAREVKVNSNKDKRDLVLKNREMVFNKAIPDQIFTLKKPPMFETVFLEENIESIK